MSEQQRTKKEYIEAHANQYCHGDKEEAKEQKIVKEICKTLKGMQMKKKAVEALIEMGLPANLRGFSYIAEIMEKYEEDDSWRFGKLTVLYEVVGKKVGSSGQNVERCIREAFKQILEKGNPQSVKKYIGTEKKTNGNLLAMLYIRLQEE